MKTRVLNLGFILFLSVGMAACNKEEFYEKEFLETPTSGTTIGSVDSGAGNTQGGVDSGVDGGTAGGSTTGSSSAGTTTGGTDGGATTGTTNGGSTAGGATGGVVGGTTSGSTTGSTVGGVDGSTTSGSTTGATAGGTTGGTTGSAHTEAEEIFHQADQETKKLDIVWIIDNSGSMSDEQSALGANFAAFIDDFIAKNVNFKMAITTTDTSSYSRKGRMVTDSDVKLTSVKAQENAAQFKTDFKNLVKVGINGSGSEKGLEASEGFMEKYASTFLREDAYLAVVIISDEEDQSPKTVSQYTDYLKGIKSSDGLAKVYSVVDVNNTNCCQSGIATGSARYKDASQKTAGLIADIRDDFHNVLSDMGESIINLLDSFALAQAPVAGSLKVYVNGVITTDFDYDATTHSIKFHQNSLPPIGAEIKVTYLK